MRRSEEDEGSMIIVARLWNWWSGVSGLKLVLKVDICVHVHAVQLLRVVAQLHKLLDLALGVVRLEVVQVFLQDLRLRLLRRRRWPSGASTTSSSSTVPSFSVTVRALAIVRFDGSW
ncbi:hypothetical protein MRB53_039057 [Persea americana]|nr:hypothetical protein MRB53_039057 [Persea americana]